jgi:hypothetical protein
MRISLLLLLIISLMACGIRKNVYRSADFEETSARHQTIAVLPFYITQTGHKAKNVTEQTIQDANVKWGYTFQESLQAYLFRHTSHNRKGQPVSFQGTQQTNAILNEHNLSIEELYQRRPDELAKMLGVDAVLMTTLETQKNFSDGVAYGLAAGRAVLGMLGKASGPLYINASDINMSANLYDARDSKLIWQTYRKGGADLPNRVDDLVQYYSNWIARKFPYKS